MAVMESSNGNAESIASVHHARLPRLTPPSEEEFREAETLAHQFYTDGLGLYDEMIVGERRAKVMYLSLLAMGGKNGMGGIVIGEPGGGKSAIMMYGETIVEGLDDSVVGKIPHRMDVQPAKLTGETSELEKRISRLGNEETENISAVLKAILNPEVKAVKADEITRVSPYALNAILGILQDGGVEGWVDGVKTRFSEFDLVVSAMNNYGTAFTNRLDPAIVSRHGMGAFMGVREKGHITKGGAAPWLNPDTEFIPRPATDTAIDLEGLHKIRRAIPHVRIYEPEMLLGMRLQTSMLDTLTENDIREADPRPAIQLVRIAQTLAMFRRHKNVTESDIQEAVRYSLTARLGMRGEQEKDIDAASEGLMDRLPPKENFAVHFPDGLPKGRTLDDRA